MSYAVRLAEARDLAGLRGLIGELRPGIDPVARHEWLYRGNPAGEAISFLAVEEATGALVGMTSLFPWRLAAGGRRVLSGLGGDGWVRPEHRRRGIAATMHTACRMALEGKDLSLVVGTPTPANATPLAVAGTKDVTRVRRYVAPSSLLAVLRPTWGLGGSRARATPVEGIDPRVDRVWERAAADGRIESVRDARFYEWRFTRAPGGRLCPFVLSDAGRPFAAFALERRDRRVRIVDLLAADRDVPRALRAIAATAAPFDALELRATAGRASDLALWSYGFIGREWMPLNVMLPHGADPSEAALYHDGGRWAFSWCDTDVESTWRPRRTGPEEAAAQTGAESASA